LKKRASILFCLLLFFHTHPAISQTFDAELIHAYNNILDLKIRDEYPVIYLEKFHITEDQAFQVYIRNLSIVLDLLLVKDENKFKAYFKEEKKHYQQLEALNNDDPFVEYLKIELKVHRGLLKIRYGDRITGAFNLIRAFRQISIHEKKHTGYKYTLKTIGLLNVIISLFPDQYNWILNIMHVNPDITKGINYLKELAESNSTFKREAILIHALSKSFYSNEPSHGEIIFKANLKIFNNSLLYSYLYGLTSIKNRNNKYTIEHFDSCLIYDRNYLQIPLINYYRAETYLKELNFNKAAYLYKLYIEKPNGDEFIKDSYYKLFNLSTLFDIPNSKKEIYRKSILTEGGLNTGPDRYAHQRISNNYKPNMTLFKSRILFDGGYYERSLEVLALHNLSSFTTVEEKSEYLYRYARNYQELSKTNQAIEYFNKVIILEEAEKYYFWGNSLLNLGHIYAQNGDRDKAREQYKRALKYKGDEYKNSIKMEARTGLKKLDDN